MQIPAPPPPGGLKRLRVIPANMFAPAERTLAQTLQGLTGRKQPQIWFRGDSMYALVEAQLKREGVAISDVTSVWDLIAEFRQEIRGAILYRRDTPGLNVATSLCGPMNAVAVEESLLEQATKAGLKVLLDAREMDDRQAWGKYRSLFAPGIAVEQPVEKYAHLRDFAVAHNAFTFSTKDNAFRTEIARSLGPKAIVYGWGPDEFQWVESLSRADATGGPSDWALNLSALERLPAGPLKRPGRPRVRTEDGVRYIAFVMSDGDNIQWLCNSFVDNPSFWASPLRGTFPMTWELSTLLPVVAPRVMQYIYATARPNDGFVAGSGVPGYTYPHFQTDRAGIARQAGPLLQKADLPVVSVLNANEGDLRDITPLLEQSSIQGILYKDYAPYHRRKGEMLWHRNKPCLSYKYLLWEGLMEPEEMAKDVATLPTRPLSDPASYAIVNVHAWSYGKKGGPMEAIRRAISLLPPNTRVVTADQIIALLHENRKGFS